MLTMNLSATETLNYAAKRAELRNATRSAARKQSKRFAQIVGSDGRILDVLEVM